MLADSGVNYISLSADAFHQESIPLKYVLIFAKAALDKNIPIFTHPAWLVSESDGNKYNAETRKILEIFENIGIPADDGNVIFPSGNAAKYLDEYFENDIEYKSPYDENPRDLKTISFSANGDVLGGNINKNPILEIIKTYSP